MSAGSNGFKIKELSEWVCRIEICEVLLYFLFWHHIWLVLCWPICCFTLNFTYIYFNYAITHFWEKIQDTILWIPAVGFCFVRFLSVSELISLSIFACSVPYWYKGGMGSHAISRDFARDEKKLAGFFLELIHLERAKKTKMKIWKKKKKDKRKNCDLNSKCGVWAKSIFPLGICEPSRDTFREVIRYNCKNK